VADKLLFANPENIKAYTTTRVINEGAAILVVSHDEEDGAWQFLDGGELDYMVAIVVTLREIIDRDPSVAELADLPVGWIAERADLNSPWHRSLLEVEDYI
jgi:hypothetical protein